MEIIEINESEFFKNYGFREKLLLKHRFNLIKKELDKNNLEGALTLLTDEPYCNYPEFAFFRINTLIRLKLFDLAYNVASKQEFSNFEPIQIQKNKLEEFLNKENNSKNISDPIKEIVEESSINNDRNLELKTSENQEVKEQDSKKVEEKGKTCDEVSRLFTLIYVDKITLDEIVSADIDEMQKHILILAYHDKNDKAAGIRYYKSIKNSIIDEENRKKINKIFTHLDNKRNQIFDTHFYSSLLDHSIDYNLSQAILKQEQELKKNEEKLYKVQKTEKEEVEQKKEVVNDLPKSEKVFEKEKIRDEVSRLFTLIYVDKITLDEIVSADIDEMQKHILILAYHDKNNKAAGIRYYKSIKSSITDENNRKKLNKIFTHLDNKRNQIFDIYFYSSLLDRSIDYNLSQVLLKQEQEKIEQEKELFREIEAIREETLRKEKEKRDEIKKKNDSNLSKSVDIASNIDENYYEKEYRKKIKSSRKKEETPIIREKHEKVKTIDTNVLIKDAFAVEVHAIKLYLYCVINATGMIKGLDMYTNFEALIEKPVSDIRALKKFETLVYNISLNPNNGVKYDKSDFKKYTLEKQGETHAL